MRPQKRVLITDDVHPLLLSGLEQRLWDTDYRPEISLEETIHLIPDYEGLVINSKIKAHQALLERASRLQWIGRLGSGMEIVDQPYARELGIHLISTPEANCQAVAEHAVGMLLSLFRNLNRADRQVRQKIWQREANRGEELEGKVIGIIGYGHTGSAFGRLLQGFDVKVLVFDKYKQHLELPSRFKRVQELEEIRQEANLISLHLPLSPETKHLMDKDFIQSCRNPFYLINTSRGAVVKTTDLLEALQTGKVLGACLDVFEQENPSLYSVDELKMYEELFRLDQVVLSPHIAGWTHQSKRKIAEVMLTKLDAYFG